VTRRLVVAAAAAAVSLVPAAGAQAPAATVSMPAKLYSPSDLSVLVGTTVTWRNEDTGSHTVTADGGGFDSGYVAPGGSFVRTFERPGVYAYHCTIHRFMKGVLRVYGLVLNAPGKPIGAGGRIILTGLAPAGTGDVTLERRAPGGGWTTVAVHRARADGGYAFVASAVGPAAYRATAGRTSSPVRQVEVFPRVTVRVAGGRVAVSTAPARPGARVVLQTYDRERFAFFTAVRARLDRAGRAVLPAAALRGLHVRAVVRGDAGWSDGIGGVVVVR